MLSEGGDEDFELGIQIIRSISDRKVAKQVRLAIARRNIKRDICQTYGEVVARSKRRKAIETAVQGMIDRFSLQIAISLNTF